MFLDWMSCEVTHIYNKTDIVIIIKVFYIIKYIHTCLEYNWGITFFTMKTQDDQCKICPQAPVSTVVSV